LGVQPIHPDLEVFSAFAASVLDILAHWFADFFVGVLCSGFFGVQLGLRSCSTPQNLDVRISVKGGRLYPPWGSLIQAVGLPFSSLPRPEWLGSGFPQEVRLRSPDNVQDDHVNYVFLLFPMLLPSRKPPKWTLSMEDSSISASG